MSAIESCPGLCRKLRKLRSIRCRRFGKHLAVELDPGNFQSMHELAVRKACLTRGCADAYNPEGAILPLLLLAAGIGELESALDSFLRGAVQFALR
ncbi:MAG TPA: hypothetical protein VHB50_20580 [Bryobacteraceae bacterium]|nr:hypothetical protein [Bryobacteraceae bacterium]